MMTEAGGEVERVLSISSVLVSRFLERRNWAESWCNSTLKAWKLAKSKTYKWIQMFMARGKNKDCSCLKRACSWLHNSTGILSWTYCCRSETSMWRRKISRACQRFAGGIFVTDASYKVSSSSSAQKYVCMSLFHFMKLLSSGARSSNINIWMGTSFMVVDITTGIDMELRKQKRTNNKELLGQ